MASTEPVARTAVTNVRVFDGRRLMDPGTVMIEGGRIGPAPSAPGGAEMVDGEGGVLLPASSTRTSTCTAGSRWNSWPASA